MNPLKFSEIVEETANRSGQSLIVTEALLRFYFKEIRSALTSLAYPSVHVLNLGTFSLKFHSVEKKLSKKRALLDKILADPSHLKLVGAEMSREVEELENALKEMIGEKERKKKFNEAKKIYHEQKESVN